jgi:hypothetical protein
LRFQAAHYFSEFLRVVPRRMASLRGCNVE